MTEPAPVEALDPAEHDLAEHDLLVRLRARDERAFDDLVRSWSPLMLRVARGFVSTDASAQEVVQDTWLGFIKGLPTFEGRSSLRTWAFRILVNIAKTRGVKEHRVTPLSSLAPDEDAGPTVDPSRFRDADHWLRWVWSHGGRAVLERVPAEAMDAATEAAFAALEPARAEDGGFVLHTPIRLTRAQL